MLNRVCLSVVFRGGDSLGGGRSVKERLVVDSLWIGHTMLWLVCDVTDVTTHMIASLDMRYISLSLSLFAAPTDLSNLRIRRFFLTTNQHTLGTPLLFTKNLVMPVNIVVDPELIVDTIQEAARLEDIASCILCVCAMRPGRGERR